MKRIIAAILAIVMVFSFVACGEKQEANDDTIIIGTYYPLTGANANNGQVSIRGLQMAFDEINAAGGVKGKKLEMLTYDSTSNTEGATKSVTRLIEEKGVNVIAGNFASAEVLAVSPITEKAKVLHVGTGTGATWTNIGLNYTYRATANGDLPISSMVDQMLDFDIKTVALISVVSEYGQSGRESVLRFCKEKNIEVIGDYTYQSNETDYSGVISKAMSAGADAITLYGPNWELPLLIKQLRQNGYEDVIFCAEGAASTELLDVAGEAANGVVFSAAYVIPSTPEEGATPMIKDILTRYYDQYKEMPFSDVFYRGYDQGMLIAEALKNCADINDGESIMKAFRNIKGMELLGGSFDYTNGTGDGLTTANKWMIMNGKNMVYDKNAVDTWRASK